MKFFVVLIIALLALLVLFMYQAEAHADITPTLKRHDAPPLHEKSCQERLDKIRTDLYSVAMGEELLAIDRKDREKQHFYSTLAHQVKTTPDLNLSPAACTKTNLQSLDIVVAKWQYQYAVDSTTPQETK